MLADLKLVLRKAPGLTLTTVPKPAFSVGGATAIFSGVDGVVYQLLHGEPRR